MKKLYSGKCYINEFIVEQILEYNRVNADLLTTSYKEKFNKDIYEIYLKDITSSPLIEWTLYENNQNNPSAYSIYLTIDNFQFGIVVKSEVFQLKDHFKVLGINITPLYELNLI